MGNLLTGFGARVYHQPVTTCGDPLAPRQLACHKDHVSHECPVVDCYLGKRGDVCFGHDEDMDMRLRIDVAKRDDLIILIQDVSGDFAAYDAAEDTVCIHLFYLTP